MIAETERPSTFRFRRYREEVALRSLRQKGMSKEDNKAAADDTRKDDEKPKTASSLDSGDDGDNGTVIENLSHNIVVVDTDGKVFTEEKSTNDEGDSIPSKNNESDHIKRLEPICVVPEGTTLLLRNLHDCRVTIHLPLPAVHFVGIANTRIDFFNKNGSSNDTKSSTTHVNTTIHMTDCRGTSSLQLETPAQQLRIHRAIGLTVAMMNPENTISRDWTKGSIILEASKNVVFSVPPLGPPDQNVSPASITATTKTYWHQVVVKDFQWLRKGIASPNFRIEVLETRNHESMGDKHCTGDAIETTKKTENTVLQQTSNSEQLADSSDSEDEL